MHFIRDGFCTHPSIISDDILDTAGLMPIISTKHLT
jgi:hypothetical protein